MKLITKYSLLHTYIKFFFEVPRSLFYNLKFFPIKIAFKLPIIVSSNTIIKKKGNKIIIPKDFKSGGIRIGIGNVGIFYKKNKTLVTINGLLEFRGTAVIGHGSKIVCDGNMVIGNNFAITAESSIWCSNSIHIGNNCLISWETLLLDTDAHIIHYDNAYAGTNSSPIIIKDNVWIGCRSTILKGTIIPDNCVVAACSLLVSGSSFTEGSLIAGIPAKKVRDIKGWSL